jgi:hypothetical protein
MYEIIAVLLVIAYSNTFDIWQALASSIGPGWAGSVPVVLTAAVGTVALASAWWRTRRRRPIAWLPLAASCVLAGVALLLADPEFPAKRIHVPQYALLALVVTRGLRFHLDGVPLLAATALIAAVLGSHDELLQGLYPSRTYGLRDIALNAVSGAAGALAAYAFGVSRPSAESRRVESRWNGQLTGPEWLALIVLTFGWLLLLVALPAFRDGVIPMWPLVPLACGGVAWALASNPAAEIRGGRYVLARAAVLMLATAVYPLITHAFPLAFH